MKWQWIVRDRRNTDKELDDLNRGFTEKLEPHTYAKGTIEGTRQDAISQASLNVSSYKQIIEVRSIKNDS